MKNKTKKIIIISLILSLIICSLIVYALILFFNKDNVYNSSQNTINDIVDNNLNNDNKDIESPQLKLKKQIIQENEEYSIKSFVKNCTDNISKNCIFQYEIDDMKNYKNAGIYKIKIIAKDDSENLTTEKTTLKIVPKTVDKLEENKNNNITDNNIDNSVSNNDNHVEDNKQTISNNESKVPTTTHKNNNMEATTKTTVQKYKVDNITETNEEYSYKYGVTITKITYTYYDVYNDGSKVLTGSYDDYIYDYNTFNATTNDLKSEASSLVNQNYSSINSVLQYVNQYRSEVGVSALTLDSSLTLAAEIRALEMGWSNKFDHTRPNGSSCFSVVDELGISYYSLGENIAYGYWDAASVSNGWKNSPGHYSNMISSNFSRIGIGVVNVNGRYYWVQIFAN